MRLVIIKETGTGYLLDPNAYLDWLKEASDALPPGARAFACADWHYDIHSDRCIKDLRLSRAFLKDADDQLSLELTLSPGEFITSELTIRYDDVLELSVEISSEPQENGWLQIRSLGDVQLDEILPHAKGCSHEIQTIGGRIWIVSSDLRAEWRGESGVDTD